MRYSTGNDRVDAVGTIEITGNVTPHIWYQTIRNETGKPNFIAIAILSDIVYWYRPQEIREEGSGQVIAFKKKFSQDLLQRSYAQMADMFGISKRQATEAINFLQELGVIRKVFRTINTGGVILNNVLFIDIVPERLLELTFPKEESIEDAEFKQNVIPLSLKRDTLSRKNVIGVTSECDTLSRKNVTGVTPEGERVSPQNVTGLTVESDTNTETTTEITTQISSSVRQSSPEIDSAHAPEAGKDGQTDKEKRILQREACERFIKNRLSYDIYLERYQFDDRKMYQQTVDLIIDTICDDCDFVEIGQSRIPHEVVKSKFMKLTEYDVESVMEKVSRQTGSRIKNMHKYMLTALYRETMTSQAAVKQWVAQTMYGEEDVNETDNTSDTADSGDQYMDFIKRMREQDGYGT